MARERNKRERVQRTHRHGKLLHSHEGGGLAHDHKAGDAIKIKQLAKRQPKIRTGPVTGAAGRKITDWDELKPGMSFVFVGEHREFVYTVVTRRKKKNTLVVSYTMPKYKLQRFSEIRGVDFWMEAGRIRRVKRARRKAA